MTITNVKAADNEAESHALGARLEDATTSIEEINTNTQKISVSNGNLIFEGYDGRAITITTIGGAVCKKGVVSGNSMKVNLQTGVYLVTIDGNTYKFIIK